MFSIYRNSCRLFLEVSCGYFGANKRIGLKWTSLDSLNNFNEIGGYGV